MSATYERPAFLCCSQGPKRWISIYEEIFFFMFLLRLFRQDKWNYMFIADLVFCFCLLQYMEREISQSSRSQLRAEVETNQLKFTVCFDQTFRKMIFLLYLDFNYHKIIL